MKALNGSSVLRPVLGIQGINGMKMGVNEKGEHCLGALLKSSGSSLLAEPQGREWKEV